MTDYSYVGKGTIYIGPYDGTGPKLSIGNVSKLEFSEDEERKELKDFQSAGGGLTNSLSRISKVTMAMTLHDLSPQNLARALLGTSAAVTAGAVTGEQHTAYAGGFIRFANIPNPSIAPVVASKDGSDASAWQADTDYGGASPEPMYVIPTVANGHYYKATTAGASHAATEPTWPTDGSTVTDGTVTWTDMGTITRIKDTDYTVKRSGIVILATGKIEDTRVVTVGYTKNAGNLVQALVASAQEWKMTFDGLNEAQSGKAVAIDVHRVKFGPPSGIGFIADDFAGMDLSADCLQDTAITGTGLSQYFTVEMVN